RLPKHLQIVADIGIMAGLRPAETLGLAQHDVDWLATGQKHLHVRRQLAIDPHTGKQIFMLPKYDKERKVPLTDEVVRHLAAMLAKHGPTEVTLPWRRSPEGRPGEPQHGEDVTVNLLVTTPSGKPVWDSTLREAWHRATSAAGVTQRDHQAAHVLRHTYASTL